MKIKIIKEGLRNAETNKEIKLNSVIDVTEERANKALKRGVAVKVKNKSKQEALQDEIEKK